MRANGLKWTIGFGVLLIASIQAQAQPLFPKTQSIESMVANADLVFIAKLVNFRRTEHGDDPDGHEATIAIEETLKLPLLKERYRRLCLHISRTASVLEGWKERSSRLLVAYDSYAPKQTAVIELTSDKLEVMTADIKLIRDPESVIQLARKAVKRLPANIKRIHTFELQVPRKVVAETSWETYYDTGGHLILSVPADQHLEKRAQDSVRSEDPHLRAEGARALVYFKSDENMALVRPLLNDPAVTYFQPAHDDQAGERVFGVRNSAYETLKSWGVDVEKPVVREAVR